jgi:CopG family transcriptional regulator/antitoxin EndoAI
MNAKVMISLPEDFLAEVDRVARAENRSRSELVREAIRIYMEMRGRRRPADDPRVQRAVAAQDAIGKSARGQGEDSTEDIRRWREARW